MKIFKILATFVNSLNGKLTYFPYILEQWKKGRSRPRAIAAEPPASERRRYGKQEVDPLAI